MKTLIVGSSSNLSLAIYNELLARGHEVLRAGRRGPDIYFDPHKAKIETILELINDNFEAIIINQGILYPKNITNQTFEEIENSFYVNLITVIRLTESIFKKFRKIKIFIVGSESGKKGSFDTSYFLCKAALRSYVKERKINSPGQQILLFSPSTISDSNMTLSRLDTERLASIMKMHPKERFINNAELSSIMCDFMSSHFDYVTNTEIEINGGKFSRLNYQKSA